MFQALQKLVIPFALLLLSLTACKTNHQLKLVPGEKIPQISSYLTNGAPAEINFEGRTVLLNFWASWCAPCVAEAADLNRLQQKLGGKEFTVYGIAIDDSASAVNEFIKTHQVNFPVYLDRDGTLKKMFDVSGYPETFLIRDGKLAFINDSNSALPEIKINGPREWSAKHYVEQFSPKAEKQILP